MFLICHNALSSFVYSNQIFVDSSFKIRWSFFINQKLISTEGRCHTEFCVNDFWSRLPGGSKNRLHKTRYGIKKIPKMEYVLHAFGYLQALFYRLCLVW